MNAAASEDRLDYRLLPSYLSMTVVVTAAPHNNSMIDIFARRPKVATRAIGIADVLTPAQVRVFSDCEMRWFYEHLRAVATARLVNRLTGVKPGIRFQISTRRLLGQSAASCASSFWLVNCSHPLSVISDAEP